MKDECCEGEMPPGLASRVAVSIAVFFGWLVFLVIWLIFYAGSYSVMENIGIVVVAFLVGVAVLAMMWASWGIKFGKMAETRKSSVKAERKRKR